MVHRKSSGHMFTHAEEKTFGRWTQVDSVGGLVMSIGNTKFGIPRKYQNQIGVWYFCPKFLGFSWYFIGILRTLNVKIWFNVGIFRQN